MADPKSIYKKLNHYDWHSEAIRQYIYLLSYPRDSNQFQMACRYLTQEDSKNKNFDLKKFYTKFKGFKVINNTTLYYEPLNLTVIPYNKKNIINEKLTELYNSSQGLGKGQQNFYRLVISKYLGIKRNDCIDFLKKQSDYQLTRKPKREFERPINSKLPFNILAIDLVDLNPYMKIRENKNYRYILTVIDLFSNYTWFFPIKKKEPDNIVNAFDHLLAESGITPKMVISDGGSEFKGEFLDFLRAHFIKKITTRSYTPQPNVEKANQILRQIMRHVFIRYNTLAWLPYLKEMQESKNSFYDARLKGTPDDIMTAFENNKYDLINDVAQDKKDIIKSKFDKYKKALFNVGDFVRIKLSTVQSELRKRIKSGDSKYIVANYSPQIYEVFRVFKPKDDKLGLPTYTLCDTDSRILINPNNHFKKFKQSDLLKVDQDSTELNKAHIDKLNMIDYNDDNIDAQGDIELREMRNRRIVRPIARQPKVIEVKDYKKKEWDKILKDKIFTERIGIGRRNMKWKILNVVYDRSYKKWLVKYKPANGNGDVESSMLSEVLEDAKQNNDEWYKPEYDVMLEKNRAAAAPRVAAPAPRVAAPAAAPRVALVARRSARLLNK